MWPSTRSRSSKERTRFAQVPAACLSVQLSSVGSHLIDVTGGGSGSVWRWRHRRSRAMNVRERIDDEELRQMFSQNEKLVNALYEAREQISSLQEEVDKLTAPPSTYGVHLSANLDGTDNVLSQGRKVKVRVHPVIDVKTLKPGQELILNEGLNVVETAGYEVQGEVVILKTVLDLERAVVTMQADQDRVSVIADPLRSAQLKPGDHLLMDAKSGYLLEKLTKSEVRSEEHTSELQSLR